MNSIGQILQVAQTFAPLLGINLTDMSRIASDLEQITGGKIGSAAAQVKENIKEEDIQKNITKVLEEKNLDEKQIDKALLELDASTKKLVAKENTTFALEVRDSLQSTYSNIGNVLLDKLSAEDLNKLFPNQAELSTDEKKAMRELHSVMNNEKAPEEMSSASKQVVFNRMHEVSQKDSSIKDKFGKHLNKDAEGTVKFSLDNVKQLLVPENGTNKKNFSNSQKQLEGSYDRLIKLQTLMNDVTISVRNGDSTKGTQALRTPIQPNQKQNVVTAWTNSFTSTVGDSKLSTRLHHSLVNMSVSNA